jgi:hypothetical protein
VKDHPTTGSVSLRVFNYYYQTAKKDELPENVMIETQLVTQLVIGRMLYDGG